MVRASWIVGLGCIACGGAPGDAAKPESTPSAAAPAKAPEVKAPEAKTPEAKTPEAKAPEAKAPLEPAAPTIDPAAGSTAALPAVGTPPPWSTVLSLAREAGLRKPAQAAPMAGLGGGRWAAVLRTTDSEAGDDGGTWSTHLLVLDAAATPPRLLDRRVLVTMAEGGLEGADSARAAVFADDYDGDGAREILLRFGFARMLCGIGQIDRRELRIYHVAAEGTLRPQVALTLDDTNYREGTTARESFADRNADGRADLVIAGRGFVADLGDGDTEPPPEGAHDLYLYVPARDEYAREGGKPRARKAAPIDYRLWDECDDPDSGEPAESPGSGAL
ncbi:MAG: hypothetical protein K1X88_15985 [Nannocystaceae bacterium]|nr:hypothetical protein [Nannocystaceae bacterium]